MTDTAALKLQAEFSAFGFIRYAAPRMLMSLVVMSYLVADGLFVSRWLGTTALSSLSMAYPTTVLLMAFGVTTAAGSATCAARALGAGDKARAEALLSTALAINALLGLALGAALLANLEALFERLGMTPEQMRYALPYTSILLSAAPIFLTSFVVQAFLTASGNPGLSLAVAVLSGSANALLDWLMLGVWGTGIEGAALATAASWLLATLAGLLLLRRPAMPIRLRFARPRFSGLGAVFRAGSFEFVSNLSVVATLWLFNRAFLAAYGVDGVAALATATFTAYVFNAAYHGFCEAAGPIIAYKAGRGDIAALRRAIRAGTTAIAAVSAVAFLLSNAGADIIIRSFAPENAALRALLAAHYPAYAFSLLFLGLNLFLAYVLSATERGHCAAGLSLVRTFVLPTAALFALPLLFEADGLWLAVPAAECLTLFLTAAFLLGRPSARAPASQL